MVVPLLILACTPDDPADADGSPSTTSSTEPTVPDDTGDPVGTTGDTASSVTDTGTTGSTTTPPDEPFADCVGTRIDSFGSELVYEYDALGHLTRWTSDYDGDGVTDDVGTYTYVLDGERILEVSWSTRSGSSGTTVYDEHEHPESGSGFNGFEKYTTTWANTHDASGLLTRSVSTSSNAPGSVATDYDACELYTRIENDVYGDGSLLYVTTAVWTVDAACVPSQSVMTSDSFVLTTTYDSAGRTLTENASSYSATWSWSCP